MEGVGSLQTKLSVQNVRGQCLGKLRDAKGFLKASDDLIVREMTNWKQVLFHPDGVPNGEALLRVSEVIAVSSGIQSEAARTLPWCSTRIPSSVSANAGRRKPPLVSVR
jgi:hypothetical protein